MSASRDVSLAIFIAFVSGGNSFTSYTNHFFHFHGPPGMRLAFDEAKRNGRFGCIQCQRSEESSGRGKRKRRVFLYRRSVRVEINGKVIQASFLKIEKGDVRWGGRPKKERRLIELVGDQNPGFEAPPRIEKERERRERM